MQSCIHKIILLNISYMYIYVRIQRFFFYRKVVWISPVLAAAPGDSLGHSPPVPQQIWRSEYGYGMLWNKLPLSEKIWL